MPDLETFLSERSNAPSWTAGCAQLSLHLLELEAGLWFESASLDHSLHVRLDRLGQVSKQRIDGSGSDHSMLPAATAFVPAGSATGWRVAATFRRLVIRLHPPFLHTLLGAEQDWPEQLSEPPPAHDPVIDHCTGLILHEINASVTPDRGCLEAYARLIGQHVVKQYVRTTAAAAPNPGLRPEVSEKIDNWIRNKLPEPVVIEELAAACGLSHYQLLRLIKLATGGTPQNYVMQQRIELARKMLRESELPLSEIALNLGFSSQSHFSNAFKTLTQITPKAYRERADLI